MSYTTTQDLETAAGGAARFLELTDWDNDGDSDAAIVAQAQSEVDGWIDSHLRRFSDADLARLRATPTPTIKRIAAAEVIFWLREKRNGLTPEEISLHEARERELVDMRADKLRPDDSKTPRASFIDNDSDVSRDGTKGMW